MTLAIIILLIFAYYIEAFTDFHIIQNQKDNEYHSYQWHMFDLLFHAVMFIMLLILTNNDFALALFLPVARWFVFNTKLNHLRGKVLWYRGDKEHWILRKYNLPIFILSTLIFVGHIVYLILR